jgi:glycosyltransferase involved in cell wall biosynthesis
MEGLGSAVLAAMASQVPVIASRVGGVPETVEHERTGLLVGSTANQAELAGAVRRLLDDPTLAAEMGRLGKERVEREFSVEAMVEGTLHAYEEVVR